MLNSHSRREYDNMPSDFLSTNLPTRHLGDSFNVGHRRDRIIDASSTVVTEHITTSISTLDLRDDPVHKRWYNRDNHHTYSGNEYSSGGSRELRYPPAHTSRDVESIGIEAEGAGHNNHRGIADFEYDHEHDENQYEITIYEDDGTIEYVVEEVEPGYDHEETSEVVVELELDESHEYDHGDAEYQHGDDGMYSHDQLGEMYDLTGAIHHTQRDFHSLGYDHDEALGSSARVDFGYENQSVFDLTGDEEDYDGNGNWFDGAEEGEHDYGDDDGVDYQGDGNSFDALDYGEEDYGDDYAEYDNDDYGDDDYD